MCDRVAFLGGSFAIVCGVRRGRRPACVHCGEAAEFECDGLAISTTRRTCDRPLCRHCRIHVPPNKDFCRDHRAEARGAASQLRLFPHVVPFERRHTQPTAVGAVDPHADASTGNPTPREPTP